jgi:hypothetical protein
VTSTPLKPRWRAGSVGGNRQCRLEEERRCQMNGERGGADTYDTAREPTVDSRPECPFIVAAAGNLAPTFMPLSSS